MPRLNGRWEYGMGIGGIQGSLLETAIPDAYGPYFYNDDTVLFPQSSDNKLYLMDVHSGKRDKVSDGPANEYKAGGNNWAAWSPSTGLVSPTFNSIEAGLLDVGPDGAVGIVPNRQVGIGCDVVEMSGEHWNLTPAGIVYDLQLLGNKRAIWRDDKFKIQTYGIPFCVQVGNAYKPKAIFSNGEWWVSYWSDGLGLVLHPFVSTIGYLINTTDSFGNVAGASDPFVNIGWSIHEGETVGEYRNKVINVLTDVRKELQSAPVGEEVMIPAFERPMWMAPFFSYHTRYGDTPPNIYTGNAILQLADDQNQARFPGFGMPLIVDVNCPSFDPNLTVAYYASGGTIGELQASVALGLSKPEKPVIAYLDGRGWPTSNPFNSDRVWPAIQCYRGPSESLSDFQSAIDAVFRVVKAYGLPMVLVDRFDDFNGSSTVAKTLECMPYYEFLLRNESIVGHMPFADRRGNGIAHNPDLYNWARAFQYAIPFGRPNRFDYWKPSGLSNEEILKNKFGQTRASVVIEPYLRTDILSKYDSIPAPVPGVWPDLLGSLRTERAKYPTMMTADQCVEMLNTVAKREGNGWGLIGKTGGNHGSQPITGIACSVDWLVNKDLLKGTDCLINAGDSNTNTPGPSIPSWPSDGDPYDGSRFVEPV